MSKEGGSQGQNGFQPANAVNKNRQVIGTYAEIEMEMAKSLLLSLATRYEYYSDFGSNLAGKLAARYKFSRWLLWRGSVSNGFRAPALQQRYYSLITTTSRNGILFRTGTFRNESPIAKAFGIAPLKAETALNFSTGFTSSLSKNISIAIDAYWIQIENRIIYSGTIPDLPAVRGILDGNGFKDVQNVRFFSNAINTRTKGLDIVITGRWFIEKSTLETTLAANFNQTSLYGSVQYAKNLPDDSTYRSLLVSREERCRVEDAYPGDKMIFDLVYKAGKWRFNSNFTRYGKVAQYGSQPTSFPDEIFTSKIITSMNLCYLLKPWLELTVGAENLGDVYPDKLEHKSNTVNGLTPYSLNFAPFGVNGGYYFINMAIKL
jgi:iron complex outermembrane receptor protein